MLLACDLDTQEHINLKEFRMMGTVYRRLAKRPATHRLRVPLLSDSEVSVAVRAKGRSASRQLNREAHRQLPHVVGGELYPAPVWGPT